MKSLVSAPGPFSITPEHISPLQKAAGLLTTVGVVSKALRSELITPALKPSIGFCDFLMKSKLLS